MMKNMKGHCAFPFCKGFKNSHKKSSDQVIPLFDIIWWISHSLGGKASIPSVVYKGPCSPWGLHSSPASIPNLVLHFIIPVPCSYTAVHTPASGLHCCDPQPKYSSLLPFPYLFQILAYVLPSYWNLSWSVWFVHLVYSQCLEWCLSQVDAKKYWLTEWMNGQMTQPSSAPRWRSYNITRVK